MLLRIVQGLGSLSVGLGGVGWFGRLFHLSSKVLLLFLYKRISLRLFFIFVDRAAADAVGADDVVALQVDLLAFDAPGFYVFVPGKIDR